MKEDIAYIPLSKGKRAMVDIKDYEVLNKFKWYCTYYGYAESRTYIKGSGRKNQKQIKRWMHRLILNAPKGMQVDHINHDRLDNRRSNLRICTPSQNRMNSSLKRENKTGVKGVYFLKRNKKWGVSLQVNKSKKHIGYFEEFEKAVEASLIARKKYHGEFAFSGITR